MATLFWLHIGLTVMSFAALCACAYCVRACRSTGPQRRLSDQDSRISDLQVATEKLQYQIQQHHGRLAARERLERERALREREASSAPQLEVVGDDKDAIRKQLGAQAGMIGPRR
jgi:hypothetical protein